MAGIFTKALSDLTSVMNYRLFRQGIISGNIANIDTPGYKAKDAAFEKELETRLKMTTTDAQHVGISSSANRTAYPVKDDPFARIGNDSNTVDIDREMMKLSQNHLLYNASAQMIQSKIESLKNAIASIK